MGKYLYSLGLIALGLALGQSIKILVDKNIISKSIPAAKCMKIIQLAVVLGLEPVVVLGAFWIVRLDNLKIATLPILGVGSMVLGGVLGLAASKIYRHEKRQAGSMFVSSSFTNIGTFGGLVCFTFFGELSYAYVSVYKLLQEFYYFPVGYPIAKLYGSSGENGIKKNPVFRILTDPFVLVYLCVIALGTILNTSGLTRPPVYRTINETLIPVTSVMLVTSVGFNMRIGAIGAYLRECLTVASIKFLVTPVIITTIAYLAGFGSLHDGLVLKVVLVLSAMPPAFNSLIPPQLYNLDTDLANSCWLFGTVALVVVLPVLYIVQGLI